MALLFWDNNSCAWVQAYALTMPRIRPLFCKNTETNRLETLREHEEDWEVVLRGPEDGFYTQLLMFPLVEGG